MKKRRHVQNWGVVTPVARKSHQNFFRLGRIPLNLHNVCAPFAFRQFYHQNVPIIRRQPNFIDF